MNTAAVLETAKKQNNSDQGTTTEQVNSTATLPPQGTLAQEINSTATLPSQPTLESGTRLKTLPPEIKSISPIIKRNTSIPLLSPDLPLETLAEHQTFVFDSLRQSIKLTGDMFAFGKPTPNILSLMLKIYHENIIRILSSDIPEKWVNNVPKKLKCMFGIMEDKKGDLYVTISESPGTDNIYNSATDPEYRKKKCMMINLLKAAKVDVSYPEKYTKGFFGETKNETLPWRTKRGTLLNVINAPIDHPDIRGHEYIRKPTEYSVKIKNIIDRMTQGGFKNDDYVENKIIMKQKQLPLSLAVIQDESIQDKTIKDSDRVDFYDKNIRNYEMKVKWVDSCEYLSRRRTFDREGKVIEQKPTFRPYIKYKEDSEKSWKGECNNGHLCTESKMFAFAHFNKITPVSFVAYWINDELPPENHIIRGYCYRNFITPGEKQAIIDKVEKDNSVANKKREIIYRMYLLRNTINKERELLAKLTNQCTGVLWKIEKKEHPFILLKNKFEKEKLIEYMKYIVQPCAVTCPGCFANIQAYKEGKMTLWDSTDCYKSRTRIRTLKYGGRKTRRNLKSAKRITRKAH